MEDLIGVYKGALKAKPGGDAAAMQKLVAGTRYGTSYCTSDSESDTQLHTAMSRLVF